MSERSYAVLAPVSRGYSPLKGRLSTCYSPVCHSTHLYLPSRSRAFMAFAFDLHVLGAPPALILSRDQTLDLILSPNPSRASALAGFHSQGQERFHAPGTARLCRRVSFRLKLEIVYDELHVQPDCQRSLPLKIASRHGPDPGNPETLANRNPFRDRPPTRFGDKPPSRELTSPAHRAPNCRVVKKSGRP